MACVPVAHVWVWEITISQLLLRSQALIVIDHHDSPCIHWYYQSTGCSFKDKPEVQAVEGVVVHWRWGAGRAALTRSTEVLARHGFKKVDKMPALAIFKLADVLAMCCSIAAAHTTSSQCLAVRPSHSSISRQYLMSERVSSTSLPSAREPTRPTARATLTRPLARNIRTRPLARGCRLPPRPMARADSV